MRIALVSNTLPPEGLGGSESYVADLARTLSDRHDVLVATGAAYSQVPGVPTARLPHLGALTRPASIPARTVWHVRDQWRPSVHVSLLRELRSFRPDVVNTHHPQGLSAAVYTAVARSGVPHVHTAHDLDLFCVRTMMTRNGVGCGGVCVDCHVQRHVRTWAIRRRLNRVICLSDYMRRRYTDAAIVAPDGVVTIRPGAHPGTARVRSDEERLLRIGYLGSLVAEKGVSTLLAAFRCAPRSWALSIAGSGPLAAQIRTEAAVDPRITYAGHVSGAIKDQFLDGLDLLLIPSEVEEAASLVAVEAAVRGLPCVVSDRGGLPEVPEARVFAARDPRRLREAVAWWINVPGRLSGASTRLLAANEHFLWRHHAARVESILREAATPATVSAGREGGDD